MLKHMNGVINIMKPKHKVENIRQKIEAEINDIETAMACDDSVSSFSLAFAEAEERLEYLKKLLKKYETKT